MDGAVSKRKPVYQLPDFERQVQETKVEALALKTEFYFIFLLNCSREFEDSSNVHFV